MDKIFEFLNYESGISISGLTNELSVFCVINKYKNTSGNVLVVTNTIYEANNLYKAISNYTKNVSIFPMDDFITSVAIAVSPEFKATRLDVLNKNYKHQIIITNLMGYLRYLPSNKVYENSIIHLNKGSIFNRDKLVNKLDELGYRRDSLVTSTGEFAVRGFVVDIFIMGQNNPVRIEFFDDEVETIKEFDYETQLTTNVIDEITITPFTEVVNDDKSSLFDYINPDWVYFVDRPQIDAAYKKLENDIVEYFERKNEDFNIKKYNNLNKFNYSTDDIDLNAKEITNYHGNLINFKDDVDKLLLANKKVYFCTTNKELKSKIVDIFNNSVTIVPSEINKGFIVNDIAIFSTNDIEGKTDNKINFKPNIRKLILGY